MRATLRGEGTIIVYTLGCTNCIEISDNLRNMNSLPFTNVQDNDMLDIIRTKYSTSHSTSYLGTNNDNLFQIDPDLNVSSNLSKRHCQNFETSLDLKTKYGSKENITFLHSNICSSGKKLKDLSYYLEGFDISFSFIGLSETWATKTNEDILNMPGYNHEHCIRVSKKGGGVSIYILNTIQYKVRKNLALPKHLFESIFIEVDKSIFKSKTHIIKRNHSYKNIANFKKCVNKINWNTVNNILYINPAFTLFMNRIVDHFKECFPIETIKINYKNRNPWITQNFKSEIKVRDKLFIQSRKHPTQENKDKYKQYKNMNLSKQRKAERDYYREQFDLHQTDLKKSWNIIKNIIGKEDKRCSVRNIDFLINNQYISDSKVIANAFNMYFINVGSSLANNIHSKSNPLLYVQSTDKCMAIPEVHVNEVNTIISAMKNSASGYDELPTSILKQCVDSYITPLTCLINMSISQGIFPNQLKLARVIPLFKGEDEQLVQNYRPISVLPFFSKIFEKVMASYVIDFFENNNMLYKYQFGFRKNHSTSHAIITLVERVSKALDTGKYVVGVFLDLKKAFDTVDHSILLNKLYLYGIRGNIHNWFKSYLTNRSQYVEYNNVKSKTEIITHGVPQGSILGPLLFIIYMNDFSRSSELLFSILFADDTSVFIEGTCLNDISEILNTELEKISIWLEANKLTININKTHYMMFHRTRIKHITNFKIYISNNAIDRSINTKFLGVIIDNKLNWAAHILYIKNKISKSIGIIYKIRHFLDKRSLRNMYFTFIYPYLIYCLEIWGNTYETHLNPLIKIQKRSIRTITFSHYQDHTGPLFDRLNILDLKKLVIQRISLLMFKCHHNILTSPLNDLFTVNNTQHNHYTRQHADLHVNTGSRENVYSLFSFHGIHIWNHISKKNPINVSYACYKNLSKNYIKNNNIIYRIF